MWPTRGRRYSWNKAGTRPALRIGEDGNLAGAGLALQLEQGQAQGLRYRLEWWGIWPTRGRRYRMSVDDVVIASVGFRLCPSSKL
jgi:hypothetical protein